MKTLCLILTLLPAVVPALAGASPAKVPAGGDTSLQGFQDGSGPGTRIRDPKPGIRIDGTLFEQTLDREGRELVLKGTALLTYLVFIKAYAGALYLPADVPAGMALADVPKHLVLEYRVAIKARDFARATRESIRKAVAPEIFQGLEARIRRLNSLYRDVVPGDRYSLTYIPGRGTELALNGSAAGLIQGADFARALFGVWLGDEPIDRDFRDTLLGAE